MYVTYNLHVNHKYDYTLNATEYNYAQQNNYYSRLLFNWKFFMVSQVSGKSLVITFC